MKRPLARLRLVQCSSPRILVLSCERLRTAPLRALSPTGLLTAIRQSPLRRSATDKTGQSSIPPSSARPRESQDPVLSLLLALDSRLRGNERRLGPKLAREVVHLGDEGPHVRHDVRQQRAHLLAGHAGPHLRVIENVENVLVVD